MNFTKGNKYSRNDVFRMYFNKELPNKGTGNWTTGYVRPDNTNDLIVFMNLFHCNSCCLTIFKRF